MNTLKQVQSHNRWLYLSSQSYLTTYISGNIRIICNPIQIYTDKGWGAMVVFPASVFCVSKNMFYSSIKYCNRKKLFDFETNYNYNLPSERRIFNADFRQRLCDYFCYCYAALNYFHKRQSHVVFTNAEHRLFVSAFFFTLLSHIFQLQL